MGKHKDIIQEQDAIYQKANESTRRDIDAAGIELRNFFDDGLSTGSDMPYKAYLHVDETPVAVVGASSVSSVGFEGPKSDRLYGHRPGEKGRLEMKKGVILPEELNDRCEPVDGINHPFFSIEGKQANGDTKEMINKSKKASASLVYNHRCLRKAARLSLDGMLEGGIGADNKTYVFAAALSAEIFRVFVGFVDIDEDRDISYNLQQLHMVPIDDADALKKGRRWAHNIITWGLWERIKEINEMRGSLFESGHSSKRTA